MNYNQVFTLLKIFPKLFLNFSNLNIGHLAAQLLMNFVILPEN